MSQESNPARKKSKKMPPKVPKTQTLKGWQAIASFMGQTPAVVERWAREAELPVSRQGRYMVASAEELHQWLGRQSGEPVRLASDSDNLSADLKRGLAYIRSQKKPKKG